MPVKDDSFQTRLYDIISLANKNGRIKIGQELCSDLNRIDYLTLQ